MIDRPTDERLRDETRQDIKEMRDWMQDIDGKRSTTAESLAIHEAVCAERYKALGFRLNLLIGLIGLVCLAIGKNEVVAVLKLLVIP